MVRVIRLKQAAERLGVSPATLRAWKLKRKHLDFCKLGRTVAVTEESLDRLIKANLIPARER